MSSYGHNVLATGYERRLSAKLRHPPGVKLGRTGMGKRRVKDADPWAAEVEPGYSEDQLLDLALVSMEMHQDELAAECGYYDIDAEQW